jgi:5'-phosphate synthase pdxT subunit
MFSAMTEITQMVRQPEISSEVLVGLLAFQGAYNAHGKMLAGLGAATLEVRTAYDLRRCTHLAIPGGESTAFLKLLEFHNLTDTLRKHAESGKPILATCAGLIMISTEVLNPPQESLGLINLTIERNAYGRQVDSFEADLDIPSLGPEPFPGIFIRSPKIKSVGDDVEVLSSLEGSPVLVRQGNIIGATFHPELSDDTRIHELFLKG